MALAALVTAAALSGTFVARLPKADAPMLREIAKVECKECGTEHGRVDLWKPDSADPEHIHDSWSGEVDVRGGPALRSFLANRSHAHDFMHEDFEAVVEAERKRLRAPRAQDRDDWFDDYRTADEIGAKMNEFVEKYADVSLFTVGQSYLGEDIKGIRFGSSPEKHAVYIECGLHAREWITHAVCMYVAEKLLEGLKNGDEVVTELLSKTYVYMVPDVNPDGYRYTWETDRMWRKNRQPNQGTSAMGTDLNRNWDADWGKCGASTNPSSNTYRGAHVWSAPEAAAVRDFVAKLKRDGYKLQAAHDIHSYGDLLLRPRGWTYDDTPNDNIEKARGAKMCQAISEISGRTYVNQKSIDLYCCSGLCGDWFAQETAQGSAFTFELRGEPGGFVLPPDQIRPNGEEIYAALIVWFKEVTYTMKFNTKPSDKNLRD